jgi:hypothetical protein
MLTHHRGSAPLTALTVRPLLTFYFFNPQPTTLHLDGWRDVLRRRTQLPQPRRTLQQQSGTAAAAATGWLQWL